MNGKFKSILFILLLIATTVSAALLVSDGTEQEEDEELSLIVISDTHLMAPELLKEEGKAFRDYVANDRKMLKESALLMKEVVERILLIKPQYVLISGDLTKDGEWLSHEYLRDSCLSLLRRSGIEVFVIPGNHDVDNPHAVEFLDDKTQRVRTPNAQEFAEIYWDYGYGQAIARDKNSLSYVVQLNDNVRLLALDGCKYEENNYDNNTCVTGGRLKQETMDFVHQQAREANAKQMRLIAMVHHGVVQHWKWQEKAMPEYLLDDWKKTANDLAKCGIEIVFTGHFHAHDIVTKGSICDIETGSLVSYPSPYRRILLRGNTISIHTEYLTGKYLSLPSHMPLEEYSEKYAASGVNNIVGRILPKDTPKSLKDSVCYVLGQAYVAHLKGNEQMPKGKNAEIEEVADKLRKYSWKLSYIFRHAAKNLWTDLGPKDDDVELKLSK